MSKILKIIVITLTFACTCLAFSDDKKKDDFWLPMEERVKTWDAVVSEQLSKPFIPNTPRPYTISSNGLEATFEKDGAKWTIVGANAPIVNPTVYPKEWPVKGNDFEVVVIPEPITNYKILPFTEKIENAIKSDTISITGAPDSYEPASFVIRSGDVDLKDVMVEVTDLKAKVKDKNGKAKTAIIPKENIDIRLVKCWYQAGVAISDTKHKLLTPELLLHDDDVVRVDYDRQVDLLRNLERIEDAEKLKPFDIPKKQNKQVWLTAHITKNLSPGKYVGSIAIRVANHELKKLTFHIEVLPFTLPEPMLDYALYYEGRLFDEKETRVSRLLKTEQQLLNDFKDMKEHGLTNVTVWHQVDTDKNKWDENWKRLKRTLELRKEVGWGAKPLLYLDWKTNFKDDIDVYKQKIKTIVAIADSSGIKDIYIYGVDERKGKDLLYLRPLYKAVHEAGAKNFVACGEDFIIYVPDLIDLPVLYGQPNISFMKLLKRIGFKVWNYANPQAGIEEPETYRGNFGIKLLINGFTGVCDYIYQQEWNDFLSKHYRQHTMAYTSKTYPIPTLQWEGWRQGVNDVRYLTLLKKRNMLSEQLIELCSTSLSNCRKNLEAVLRK